MDILSTTTICDLKSRLPGWVSEPPRHAFRGGATKRPSIGVNFSKSETLPVMENLFNGLHAFVKNKKRKAVVVFDEFQQVGELEDDRIEKSLRGVIQDHREISYIFMGSKKHLIYDMFNKPERPFFKSSAHFPLKKIDSPLFLNFIKEKFVGSGRKIQDEACAHIIDIAEAHPFYTQLLAHTVWESVESSRIIGLDEVDAGVNRILKREEATFVNLWDNLTLKQKRLLLALALKNDDDKIFSADFLNRYNLRSSGTVQRGVKSLMNKGIIDKEGDVLELNDVFLKRWLNKRMSYSIKQNLQ